MRIHVESDRMGSLILTPVNQRLRRRIIRHLADFGVQSDGTAYIQTDYDAAEFLLGMKPGKRRDVLEGWGATIEMDPWVFGHYIGYDAHEVL